MKLLCEELLTWRGEVARRTFLGWVLVLFAVKYNLDRLVLKAAFGRDWSLRSYFEQPLPWGEGLTPARNAEEFAALLIISLPFLWMGAVLCLKRLRSARLPLWLAVLLIVPLLKWFLFVALAIVPARREVRTDGVESKPMRWLPQSTLGSAVLAAGTSMVLAVVAIAGIVSGFERYGWALFVGVPFAMGFLCALILGSCRRRRLVESLMTALLAIGLTGVALLALAFEGAICLVMAAPIAAAMAVVGAVAGHAVQTARWEYRTPPPPPHLYCVPLLAISLMVGSEQFNSKAPPEFAVSTTVDVDAPPELVWRHVIAFPRLPEPKEAIFRFGIAYPTDATIHGQGVGAVRYCNFSTGPFVEPITVWDAPRLLKFSVTENPAPMQEMSPYGEIQPPHLHGFMVSNEGQFRLVPLPGGRTRLEGTTWYLHSLWPAPYWRLWSDGIIHTIHRRVLNHVKSLSEAES